MTGPEGAIHRAAAEGFSRAADDYVRGRPDYPAAVADWLRDTVGVGPGATAVDLGAGTGKFTPYLVGTGARVVAVEPVDAMRARLSAAWPGVDARAGTAEAIPLPDASADAVVCAQSFHWFATPAALAEVRRVLKPGGRLGLVWNVRDLGVGWVSRLGRVVGRVEGDTPRYQSGAWRSVFPAPGFGPLRERRFPHAHTGPVDDVVLNRVRSTSFVAALPPDGRARLEAELRAFIASEPELQGKAVVTVPYETVAYDVAKAESSQ